MKKRTEELIASSIRVFEECFLKNRIVMRYNSKRFEKSFHNNLDFNNKIAFNFSVK